MSILFRISIAFSFLVIVVFIVFSSLDKIFEFLEVVTNVSECFFKSEPRQKILIVSVLRQGIFFIPLIAEQVGRSVESRSVHCVIQKRVYFVFILLVEARRVGVVDKFSYHSGLTAVIEHVRKDMLFIVVVAPSGYDVIADPFCQLVIAASFKVFDVS